MQALTRTWAWCLCDAWWDFAWERSCNYTQIQEQWEKLGILVLQEREDDLSHSPVCGTSEVRSEQSRASAATTRGAPDDEEVVKLLAPSGGEWARLVWHRQVDGQEAGGWAGQLEGGRRCGHQGHWWLHLGLKHKWGTQKSVLSCFNYLNLYVWYSFFTLLTEKVLRTRTKMEQSR